MTELFRREATDAQRQSWLGEIAVIRPVPLSVSVGVVVVATIGVVFFLCVASYERKARVSGVLVPERGVIRLMPPDAGTVAERPVREGQLVRRGDTLFVLAIDRVTSLGEAQGAVRDSLIAKTRSLNESLGQQTALLAAQRAGLERQVADRRTELGQLDAEAALQRQRLALAQETVTRWDSLKAEQFVSAAQVQAKTEELLAVQAQVQAIERQRAAQRREIGSLEAARNELPLRAQNVASELERDLATVAKEVAESEARQRIVVRAPGDGTVGTLLADAGQAVTPSSALGTLVPADSALQAHLYAPSSALGFVRPGQQVLLRYEAYAYQKFGHQTGRVLQVSRTPLQSSELAGVPLAGVANFSDVSGEPLYRITVALDQQTVTAYGEPQPLVAGMQLDADVRLERRRLIEWMLEPLLGLTGRLRGQDGPGPVSH